MEALTISAANLDIIERNLGAVAKELTGVITNVNDVNNQVNKVEEKVAILNDEVKNLVKEIKETTIITNARQNIMYNNDQIEKKYGYYDRVRRTTESLIDAIENSNISIKALVDLKQELILNNPNYWLSNALAALTSWILNDREDTEKELHNALKKDSKKTSLFFCLINLKLGRNNTSINWLNKYLSEQTPTKLDKDFLTVLDLVASGVFNDEAKEITFNKIATWFTRLNSESSLHEKQITTWINFIESKQDTEIKLPQLEIYSKDANTIKNNLAITSSYQNILNYFEQITYQETSNKKIEEILSELIYEYETKEQIYQKDNLRNKLIIECNGDREKAETLFQKQESIYNNETDLLTLLSNIVIYKDSYKISNETQKIALSLIKDYITEAFEKINKNLDKNDINITIDGFITKTNDGKNLEETKKDLDLYLTSLFNAEDKDLIVILLIINILGIIGIFITFNNKVLSTILIIILILGNIIFFSKLNQRNKLRTIETNKIKNRTSLILEKVLAETIDYLTLMKYDETYFNRLKDFLKNLNTENFIKTNNERNIKIGE